MFERIKKAPRRRQIGAPVFLVVLGLAIWATKERGAFDGVTLLVGSLGLMLGLLQMIPARPKLKLTGRDDEPLIIFTPVVRPFDENSIVKEQVSKALKAMPRRPAPEGSTASAFDYESRGLGPGRVGLRHSDETLREHEGKVFDFESHLREWVTDLDAARGDRLRLCEKELRLHELGYAPADHAHLRLFFPEGFELEDEAPSTDSPPDPPDLMMEGRIFPRQLEEVLPIKGGIKLHHPDDEPHYSEKNGLPVVDYDLGRINQADHRDVPAFELKAPKEPGRYEIEWEASAAGLNRPASGTITFEVRARRKSSQSPPWRKRSRREWISSSTSFELNPSLSWIVCGGRERLPSDRGSRIPGCALAARSAARRSLSEGNRSLVPNQPSSSWRLRPI